DHRRRRSHLAGRPQAAGRLGRRYRRGPDPAAGRAYELRRRRGRVYRLARRGKICSRVQRLSGQHHRDQPARRIRLLAGQRAPDLLWHARGRQGLDRQLGLSLGHRQRGLSVAAGTQRHPGSGRANPAAGPLRRPSPGAHQGRAHPIPQGLLQGVRGELRENRQDGGAHQQGAAAPRHLRGQGYLQGVSRIRPERALLRHRGPQPRRHRPSGIGSEGGHRQMTEKGKLGRYHAAVWDEPVVMELGYPGRRGQIFAAADPKIRKAVGNAKSLVPAAMRRREAPRLPELSEPEVQRHYLHLSQETLGMMGISLFGTCTMKYNSRLSEAVAGRPDLAELHPYQPEESLQGILEIIHSFDLTLRELSGMDQFVLQAGGGADAAYTNCCVTRAYHQARGELGRRDEIITSIQAHPSNSATAAAAGFKVVTLQLEENGYPSLEALKAAVSARTAALLIGNPDDMGIYNPEIREWTRIVHEAGGLCFYDHANFNGVMGKLRARDLGFDACMYMLHKTFGAPKGGGGPAVGAYGCSRD